MFELKNVMAHGMPTININISVSPLPEIKKKMVKSVVNRQSNDNLMKALTKKLSNLNISNHIGGS